MAEKKIPDRSNFLEKYASVESLLKVNTDPKSNSLITRSEEIDNSQQILAQIPDATGPLFCNKCGFSRGHEDVFCGNCGNKF